MKRSRVNPISAKRRASMPARASASQAVIARDGVCQWTPAINNAMPWADFTERELRIIKMVEDCFGALHMHEPAHSRNVDRTNPANGQALCDFHNTCCEDYPEIAMKATLVVKGNGLPIRHFNDAEVIS